MLTECFPFGPDKPPLYFRDGTSDAAIIQANLIDRNEYMFPQMSPRVVYDIGGNIGAIAIIFANIYPEATIHTFEPVKANYEILMKNVEKYPNITPWNIALGSSNRVQKIHLSSNENNLGGFSLVLDGQEGEEIEVCNVNSIADRIGGPDLIKIDCEGSEFEILTTLEDYYLQEVQWIAGELHCYKDFALLDHLSRFFDIQVQRQFGEMNYHFHARQLNKK